MKSLNLQVAPAGELHEVRFWLDVGRETVPGLVWMPAVVDAPLPLVLIQHPGFSSKDDYFVRDVAMEWSKRGWICGGIDAPLHGERAEHDPMRLFREPERYPEVRAQFAEEVTATIDALAGELPVELGRLGFVGYSLGSMLGIPAVARDGRFRAASFGLVGEGGLVGAIEGPDADVPKLGSVAVRVIGKLRDELISREATERLYEAIPGKKDIVWLPGGHYEIGPDVVKAAGEWVVGELRGSAESRVPRPEG